MDIKNIWQSEKPIIQECINKIKYDEILVDSLDRLCIEIDSAITGRYDCTDAIAQITTTIENPRYNKDILSKASDDEKRLVNELTNSLYMLQTSMNHSRFGDKQDIVAEASYKRKENNKLPNLEKNVDVYKGIYGKKDEVNKIKEFKTLNKIR